LEIIRRIAQGGDFVSGFTAYSAKWEGSDSFFFWNARHQSGTRYIHAVSKIGKLGLVQIRKQVLATPIGFSMETQPGEITLLLAKWKGGEPDAFEQLVPLVYPHLREVAAAYIRRERDPGVMQATSLVHELYLRLRTQKKADWEDRVHFFTFCAKVMRMILIDHARVQQAQRHGGDAQHVPLSDDLAWVGIGSPELIELDRALDALGQIDPTKVQLIELRYFLGYTSEETAGLMDLSKATVDRHLSFAKAWLYRRINPDISKNTPTA
jgi:RNA polymerase sigma factor (TIGR02999 family)